MKLIISKDALKQYEKLPRTEQVKIKSKLKALQDEPYAGKRLTGDLSDYRSLKAWPYRIIYEINKKENRIDVHKIAHRQGAYK